ncbi:MAG: hypothetical protein HQL47_02950 [Gammaproteobacteria bacterium]|nr:hypothetical protein [Gammaproteobacteria bacterium]
MKWPEINWKMLLWVLLVIVVIKWVSLCRAVPVFQEINEQIDRSADGAAEAPRLER